MKFLAIKGFRSFQHYKDRRPPWIKLYATILTDRDFLMLPEVAQAQLVKLWVLASQLGHPLPNNPKLLAGQIGATGRFHLRAIIGAGFLYETDDSASADASSDPGQDASNDASTDASENGAKPSALTHADARSRERTEDRGQSPETTPPSSSTRDAKSDDRPPGITLASAANRAITARWGEQTRPIKWDAPTTHEAVAAFAAAKIPLDFAGEAIAAWCAQSKKERPPSSANYFVNVVADAWSASQEHARAGTNGNGARPLTERETLERWAAEEEVKTHA